MPHNVIIGLPRWHFKGPDVFAERLVGGLVRQGHGARILLTEHGSNLVKEQHAGLPVPEHVPADILPAGADDTWGQRWEALERYIEERAPCTYIMLHDWRNNVIAPRLSRRIRLVGLVQADSDLEFDQANRLGEWWDAIVAVSDPIHFKLASRFPHLAPRTVTIRTAMPDLAEGGYREQDMLANYLGLFERIERLRERGGFVRRLAPVVVPPHEVGGVSILPGSRWSDLAYVARSVPWPDPPSQSRRTASSSPARTVPLKDHKVLVSWSSDGISGVDVFACHLVRGLCARGIDARLHGRRPTGGRRGSELPFDERDPMVETDHLSWPERWRRIVAHLERAAPCIYVPNYDIAYSCIAPQLSGNVRVVGIAHSDDPWHYEHMCRIGHACDAVVGVSDAVVSHLQGLAPGLMSRLAMIPYGVAPRDPAGRVGTSKLPTSPPSPIRIIYTGRLMLHQKRAHDLAGIARALTSRGVSFEMVVVGDGESRGATEQAVSDLLCSGAVRFVGHQPNEAVLSLLDTADVFVLPSAFEGLSVSMLEAMARGVVPVVGDVRSGVPDAVASGTNGFAVPVGRVDLFAERIEWLWRHPTERLRMSEAAISTVATRFRLDTMVERYLELFERITRNPLARERGPIVPSPRQRADSTWGAWAARVASDPVASLRRVMYRFGPK